MKWRDQELDPEATNWNVLGCPLSFSAVAAVQGHSRNSRTGDDCSLQDFSSGNVFDFGIQNAAVYCHQSENQPLRLHSVTESNVNSFAHLESCDECQCLVNTVALWAAGDLNYFSTNCLPFVNNRSESDAANTTGTVVSVTIRRIEDPCNPSPCQNNGRCSFNNFTCNSSNGICCHCAKLFSGQFCENLIGSGCDLSPCFPGVSCTDMENGTFTCDHCPDGLDGDGITCVTNKSSDIVTVHAADADSLEALAGFSAKVVFLDEANGTVLLNKNASANDNSSVQFDVPRSRTVTVVVGLEGYASNSLVAKPVPDIENHVTLFLRKRADPISFTYSVQAESFAVSSNASAASSGNSSLSYKAIFLPDSLEASENATVLISFTGIDPTDSLVGVPDLVALPENETENQANLNSLALAEITLTDAVSGNEISLKKPVQLQLPLSMNVQASAGDKIEAWYFNESQGLWLQEGFGIVKEIDGALVWVYNASHFSWWNCDRPWYDKHCVTVLALDDSLQRPIGIDIVLTGKDFFFTDRKKTTNKGVCFDFKKDGQAEIFSAAEDDGYFSNPVLIQGKGDAATCDQQKTSTTLVCDVKLLTCTCSCFQVSPETISLPLFVQAETPPFSAVVDITAALRRRLSNRCHIHRLRYGIKTYSGNNLSPEFHLDTSGNILLSNTASAVKTPGSTKHFSIRLDVEEKIQTDPLQTEAACNCGHIKSTFNIDVVVSFTGEAAFQWFFSDSGFILGGHGGAERNYNDPSAVSFSPWRVFNAGTRLKFFFENSSGCGNDSNSNAQRGQAKTSFSLLAESFLIISWSGKGETVSSGFELMTISVNSGTVISASSPGGGGGGSCAMGDVQANVNSPFQTPRLSVGLHSITVSMDSGDSLYHHNAFYDVQFSILEVA
ncbi:uncharacterized protein [Oscarella lobularis]|uniref:uncharacterized protein n=1 Tax=Oscarella lobularis TaxID=121494 RepID=UPI003313C22B